MIRLWWSLTRFLVDSRSIPRNSGEVLPWSMARVVHLWKKTCHVDGDTFAEYLLRSGVNIPASVMRRRIWVVLGMYAWPLIAWLLVRTRHGERLEQWRRALRRPDLYAAFPGFRFSARAVDQRRSDMIHAVFNAWDFRAGGSADYAIENKKVFEARAREAGLPVVHGLSLEDARRRGGPYIVKDPRRDMGLGVSVVETFDELAGRIRGADFLVQPRLRNHSRLRAILPEHAPLCTLRLLTTWSPAGPACHVAYFRIGSAHAAIDNLSRGGTLVEVDLQSGRLLRGVVYPALQGTVTVGDGIDRIEGAGQAFAGMEFPFFFEAVDLARKAHRTIAPSLLSIGWDVALTEDGLILVEANVFAGSYEIFQFNDSYGLGNRAILERIRDRTVRAQPAAAVPANSSM